jgi:hypothetical protein
MGETEPADAAVAPVRPNCINVLHVAFGQKGRSEMKLFEIPMVVTSLVALCFLAGLDVPPARADFTFGEPVDIQSDFPFLDVVNDSMASFSADGLEMYFGSPRAGGQGDSDLWVCKRASPQDDWGPPENLGPLVNSASGDGGAFISGDGLELYFDSGRGGGYGSSDIWVTKRTTRDSPWGPPTNLGPAVNTSYLDGVPSVTSDGLELYFMSMRPGGNGGWDLYVSKRATIQDPWGPAVNLDPPVNSPANEGGPCIWPDGLLLLFQDYGSLRPGGYGNGDLWMARRASRSAPWAPAVNLGPTINTSGLETLARPAPDGSALFFYRLSGSTWTHWKAPLLPIVDFNGDDSLDAADMAMLIANWGQNQPLCDIGPFAWGDGVVDEKDLGAFIESVTSPGPHDQNVPRDVVLRWVSCSYIQTHDVYFGTSFEAVTHADRTDPCGVLVSLGQAATTYDPEGLLDYARTYYWRVDFVGRGPDYTIYKGPVVSFTTEAFAYPIKNVTAKASSASAGSGPEKTVDGSGLDKSDGHSADDKDMWLSGSTQPHWIQFEFDKVYTLHELWVWNWNQTVEPYVGLGAKTVKIEYSADGVTWTALEGVPEFARAPGQPGYTANTKVSFGGVSAKFVKLTIEKAWGTTPKTGLSEVRFFYIPDRPATEP